MWAMYTADLVLAGVCTLRFPQLSAVYTGDHLWTGVCTLVAFRSAQTPLGTTPPVRTALPSLSRQCAQPLPNDPPSAHGPTVYTENLVPSGVCTHGFPSPPVVYVADDAYMGF